MKRNNVSKVLVRSGFLMGVLVYIVACSSKDNVKPPPPPPAYANNLAHLKCNSHNNHKPVEVEIKSTPEVLADPDHQIIFVCAGETVRWFTNDDTISFTVDFANKSNPSGLFTTMTLPSHAHPSGAAHSPHPQTDDQTVLSLNNDPHLKDYIYSIEIRDAGSNIIHKIDPHVIPMGN